MDKLFLLRFLNWIYEWLGSLLKNGESNKEKGVKGKESRSFTKHVR